VTAENRARVLEDVKNNIAYIVAFNCSIELLAEHMKMPEVLEFSIRLQDVERELKKTADIEN